MLDTTQKNWVKDELITKGSISRNFALQNFVSRLGAIICELKKQGWGIRGEYVRHNWGRDFVYTLFKKP